MTRHPVYWSVADAKEDDKQSSPLGYAATQDEAVKVGRYRGSGRLDPWLMDINRGDAGVVLCWILIPTSPRLRPHGWRG